MSEENQAIVPPMDASGLTVQQMFGAVLHERIKGGALQDAIAKHVDKLIESAASDVFCSYGDVGKAIKAQLTKAVMPQIESMDDLPVYHDFVSNRLKLAAQNFYDKRLAAVLDKELEEVFSELPEQIKLSWLIEKLVQDASDGSGGESITLIMEDKSEEWSFVKPGETILVYLDKDEGTSKRDCEYDLHLSLDKVTGKYQILGAKVNHKKPGEALSMGRLYNLEKVLFNVYAMKGQIDLDLGLSADDYDTSVERECYCDQFYRPFSEGATLSPLPEEREHGTGKAAESARAEWWGKRL